MTIVRDSNGAACLSLGVAHAEAGTWVLRHAWTSDAGLPDETSWRDATRALRDDAVARGATCVVTRVPSGPGQRSELQETVLAALGFRRVSERIEHTLALALLADRAAESPLRWHALEPDGPVSLARAIDVLARVAVGDPAWSPSDDPASFLRDALAEPALRGESACVQIGAIDHERAPVDVAFVMAQANLGSGASRITYLGVVPEHRGRGLGRAAHAHGLAMLRAQGAALYRGGTTSENAPMRAILDGLGASEPEVLHEWCWDPAHARS